MGSVFEPQPILDQPALPRLTYHPIEDLLMPLHPQALAEIRQRRMMRQIAMQAQPQEKPVRHVAAAVLDHLPIRKVVLVFQELELQHQQRFNGRPTLILAISTGQQRTQPLKVDDLLDPAQIVIRRYRRLENLFVPLVRWQIRRLKRKHPI